MGIFSKKRPVSKAPLSTWTPEDVKAWAKSLPVPKPFRTAMKPIDGALLMRMDERDLAGLFNTKMDNPVVLRVIAGVKKLQGMGPASDGAPAVAAPNGFSGTTPTESGALSTQTSKAGLMPHLSGQLGAAASGAAGTGGMSKNTSASNLQPGSAAARQEPSAGLANTPGTLSNATSANVAGTPENLSRAASYATGTAGGVSKAASGVVLSAQTSLDAADPAPAQPTPAPAPVAQPMRTPRPGPSPLALPQGYKAALTPGMSKDLREHAEYLNQYMRRDCQGEIAHFLQPLERTKGLVELCEATPEAGGLFSLIFEAYEGGFDALCVQQIAAHFQDFCVDIVTLLEAAGKRGDRVPVDGCKNLAEYFVEAEALLAVFSQHGWLLHLAYMEGVKERFDEIHNRIVAEMQVHGLATFASGKGLMTGDYKDPTRALRRVLKQIGKGSTADGIYETAKEREHQVSVCRTLDIERHILLEELAHVPRAEQGVDLANLYKNLVAGRIALRRQQPSDVAQHKAIFEWYDNGSKGFMDVSDLKHVIKDLGMLEGVRDKDQFAVSQMTMADKDQDNRLSMKEFSTYYASLVLSGERHQLRSKLGIRAEDDLKHQFLAFANYGNHGDVAVEMDGAHFMKYCKDCDLVDRKAVTRTEVDLIFTKVKAKGERRINFDRFLRALGMIAERKEKPFPDVVVACLQHERPTTNGTMADNVRLHDDKSTYTGVYARGGPTNVDNKDLSSITDRSAADARGVKLTADQARAATRSISDFGGRITGGRLSSPQISFHGSHAGERSMRSTRGSVTSTASDALAGTPLWQRLNDTQRAFVTFSLFGKGQFDADSVKLKEVRMDSKAFSKLCKEAGIMDGRLTLTRVDLIFTKCSDSKTKRMTYKQFAAAVEEIADYKHVSVENIIAAINQCAGPQVYGTKADNVKWHDDKSTYTGVYAQGGPTNIDQKVSLEGMVNRQAQEYASRRTSSANRRAFQ